jgi:SAM-dependent methyltransferase
MSRMPPRKQFDSHSTSNQDSWVSGIEWGGDVKTREGRIDCAVSVKRHVALLSRCGIELAPGASVLDFGCGDGELVHAYRRAGFDAWGCDVKLPTPDERLKVLPEDGFLPFEAQRFDLIVSETVLEHVPGNQERQIIEWLRVLRPAGIALHLFPPRTSLIESHTMVPLASIVRTPAWLGMCARLGVRAPHQRGLAPRLVVDQNAAYLATRTNYLPKSHYRRVGRLHFSRVRFVEREWMIVAARRPAVRAVARIGEYVRVVPWLYGHLYYRVMLLEKSGR